MTGATPRRVAVIGSGVAGLTAAHVLNGRVRTRVTLYEADSRLGGHADTHVVDDGAGGSVAVDTGFIVHNERTYPNLMRLFDELGVQTQESDMSMSVRSDDHGLEWAGALGLAGLFPTWRNALRPSYLRMLAEIPRFHRMARRLLATGLDRHDRRRDVGVVPRPRRVLAPVPDALHGVAGRLRVVVRPGGRAGLPGALPVQLPPAPRHAADLRLAPVADRHRRLPRVRREGGRAPARRAHRHQGDLGARDPHAASRSPTATGRSRPSTRSSSPPIPARRSRCWPSPRPPSATCSARCPTRPTRLSCTPTRACCRATTGPGRRGTTCVVPRLPAARSPSAMT